MRMDHESPLTPRWIVFGTALVYFALGSVLTAHFMHLKEVWADSHHVFQLEIHHAAPGKVPALEKRFRSASRSQARHVLEVVGCWAPEAKTHWDAFQADPAFQEYLQSEKADQLIQEVDSTFMRPTDYSATK
jgi:hypothetical protein